MRLLTAVLLFQVCKPIMPGGTTCKDTINQGRYIEEFSCTSTLSTERMLKEMRLSFPSGHSSFSMYTLVYCAVSITKQVNVNMNKTYLTVYNPFPDLPSITYELARIQTSEALSPVSAHFTRVVHVS